MIGGDVMAFIGFFVVAGLLLAGIWWRNAGELVGQMTCPTLKKVFSLSSGPIVVRREAGKNAWDVVVIVRIDIGRSQNGWRYTPDEAVALAGMLEEAARKVGPH